MSGEALVIPNQSVAQRHLSTLQKAERDVLAGALSNVIVVTVDTQGGLQVHWTGAPSQVIGFLEIAKASIFSSMQRKP